MECYFEVYGDLFFIIGRVPRLGVGRQTEAELGRGSPRAREASEASEHSAAVWRRSLDRASDYRRAIGVAASPSGRAEQASDPRAPAPAPWAQASHDLN